MTEQEDASEEKSSKSSGRVRKTLEKCVHNKSTLASESSPRSILRSSPSPTHIAPRTGFRRRRRRHVSFSLEDEIFEIPTRRLLLEEQRKARRRRLLRKRLSIRRRSLVSTRVRRRARNKPQTRSRKRVSRLAKARKKYNKLRRKQRKGSR